MTTLDVEREDVTWVSAVAVLIDADRRGFDVCVVGMEWETLVTEQFVCDTTQMASGTWFRFERRHSVESPLTAMANADITLVERGVGN